MGTGSGSMEEIVEGIRNSTYELETEQRLASAGLQEGQNVAAVLEKYAWLYEPEIAHRTRAACHEEPEPSERERLRRVYHHLLEGCLGRETAALEDEIVSFEMDATVEVDGESIPYYDVPGLIAGEPDFERRNQLQDAALSVTERTNPKRLDVVRARLAALAEKFGYDAYTAYNGEMKRLDYGLLRSRTEDFLTRTEEAYEALMGGWVEEATGHGLGEVGDHHLSHLNRMRQHDPYFRKDGLVEAYERTLSGMGLDPTAQENIYLDTADRPTKNPRAHCYVPDPPMEVHLVIKPVGGFEDYAAFLHEAGHVQHFGNADPALDYVYRALPTSYAHTEVYAFLVEYLTMNRRWLVEVVGLPEDAARGVVRRKKLVEFFYTRRYAAKLGYELDFYEDPLDEARNQVLYSSALSKTTRFRVPTQNYLQDMDPGYYSADYLRAWITEAMLRRHLEDSYGEGWFAHPEAGAFLRELWAAGEGRENEDVARMVGQEPFDTTCLVEQFLILEGGSPK